MRIEGDTAIATGTIHWTTVNPSKAHAVPKTGKEHFTLVLVKDGGAWRAWSEHLSQVKAAKAP